MATVIPQRDTSSGYGVTMTWQLLNGDDGKPWDTHDYPDASIQVAGIFGVGGTIVLEGSNEVVPTNWALLNDPQANPLTFTAAKIEQVMENVRWMRPRVTGGDGTTALSINIWSGRRR